MSYKNLRSELIKSAYFTESNEYTESNSDRFYSSNNWYFKLDNENKESNENNEENQENNENRPKLNWYEELLDKNNNFKNNQFKKYILFPRKIDDNYYIQPEQQLEQLTFVGKHHFFYSSKENRSKIYTYERFLVVRTEDHIRDRDFLKAFNETTYKLPQKLSDELKQVINQVGKQPFFEMNPAIMQYVWGGHQINVLKGFQDLLLIAETWEVSTHPYGQSEVSLNAEYSIPLREIVQKTNQSDGHLPFMVKYLDCHNSLSVQCHPDDITAQYLYGSDKLKQKPKDLSIFKLKDEGGKEESFYVLQTASNQEFHLFLGFSKEELAPIAKSLNPILESYGSEGVKISK